MENDWDISQLMSPVPIKATGLKLNPPSQEKLKRELQYNTSELKAIPYLPTLWAQRSKTLYDLTYPNLAASDAYKGLLLLNAAVNREVETGELVWLTYGMSCWLFRPEEDHWTDIKKGSVTRARMMQHIEALRHAIYILLIKSLFEMCAIQDTLDICSKALELYPNDMAITTYQTAAKEAYMHLSRHVATFSMSKERLWAHAKAGEIFTVAYPWASPAMMVRIPKTIQLANQHITRCSNNKLEIRKTAIVGESNQVILGVFAKRDIAAGEIMFDSTGPMEICFHQSEKHCYNCAATIGQSSFAFECCPKMRFCSEHCKTTAHDYYHVTICGKNLSDFFSNFEQAKIRNLHTPVFNTLGWLRHLSVSVQSHQHPLQCHMFAQLTAQYCDKKPNQFWSFGCNIKAPIKVLQRLGVNVWENHDSDAWVLETLRERIKTNEYGTLHSSGLFSPLVDPVYSFHNHSCESPMIHIEDATTGRCLVTAQRNIAKDEEVFTNYLSKEILNTHTKEERHNKLQGWLAGPCFCAWCKREGKF